MINTDDFEKENAFLLSKFEDLNGKIEGLLSKNKSLNSLLNGSNFENENLKKEIQALKKFNSRVLKDNQDLKDKMGDLDRIIPQNFILRNKIASIVPDIENKALNPSEFNELMDLMIKEIDFCIDRLKE